VPACRVKLGANDLNCVDVPLNPTHSLSRPVYRVLVILQCFDAVGWVTERAFGL